MAILHAQFQEIVKRFLAVITQLASVEDLERRVGRTQETIPGERVEFLLQPSNLGTRAYTVSYVIPGAGIPIEFKLNSHLGYTKIILKMEKPLQGYEPFMADPYQNIIQSKDIQDTSLASVKQELERLLKTS